MAGRGKPRLSSCSALWLLGTLDEADRAVGLGSRGSSSLEKGDKRYAHQPVLPAYRRGARRADLARGAGALSDRRGDAALGALPALAAPLQAAALPLRAYPGRPVLCRRPCRRPPPGAPLRLLGALVSAQNLRRAP